MVSYCKNDVVLLEKVYLKLRPYILQHPHMNIQSGKVCCPKCCSEDINFRGYSMNSTGKFKRFVCKSCGGWGSLKINELSKEDRKVITKNG
jgi:transposase-like protein